MINLIFFVFFSFLLIGQVKASNIEILMDKAQSALDSGNCKTAINLFKEGAVLKNARAEYKIGYMLYKGICLEKNKNKAIQWIKLSASRDYPPALFTIAQQYRKGQNGFEKNVEKAIKYYRKAAKLNDPSAQYILGIYYLYGSEVSIKKNIGLSYEWLMKSAKQGHQPAQKYLNKEKKAFEAFKKKSNKNLERAAVTMAFLNHCVDIREGYQSVYINNIEYKKAKRKMTSLIKKSSISGDKNKILEKFYKIMIPESMDKVMQSTTGSMMFMSSDYNPEVRKQCQNFLFIIRMGKDLSSLF